VHIDRTEQELFLADLDAFLVDILRHLPAAANPEGSPAAEHRLFPDPSCGSDPTLDQDWRELVHPELQQLFQTAQETVETDLEGIHETDDKGVRTFSLRIPAPHMDAWLNTLNQARLALAAANGFGENELDRDLPQEIASSRDLALFEVQFFGILQQIMLRDLP
jgi:hypothetical protein